MHSVLMLCYCYVAKDATNAADSRAISICIICAAMRRKEHTKGGSPYNSIFTYMLMKLYIAYHALVRACACPPHQNALCIVLFGVLCLWYLDQTHSKVSAHKVFSETVGWFLTAFICVRKASIVVVVFFVSFVVARGLHQPAHN